MYRPPTGVKYDGLRYRECIAEHAKRVDDLLSLAAVVPVLWRSWEGVDMARATFATLVALEALQSERDEWDALLQVYEPACILISVYRSTQIPAHRRFQMAAAFGCCAPVDTFQAVWMVCKIAAGTRMPVLQSACLTQVPFLFRHGLSMEMVELLLNKVLLQTINNESAERDLSDKEAAEIHRTMRKYQTVDPTSPWVTEYFAVLLREFIPRRAMQVIKAAFCATSVRSQLFKHMKVTCNPVFQLLTGLLAS